MQSTKYFNYETRWQRQVLRMNRRVSPEWGSSSGDSFNEKAGARSTIFLATLNEQFHDTLSNIT